MRYVLFGGFGLIMVLGAAGGGALLPGHPQPPAFQTQGVPGLVLEREQ